MSTEIVEEEEVIGTNEKVETSFVYSNRISELIHKEDLRLSGDVSEKINELIKEKLHELKEISDFLGVKKVSGDYIYFKPYEEGDMDYIKISVVKKYTKSIGVTVSKEDLKRVNYIVLQKVQNSIYRCLKNGRKTVKEYDI